MEKSLLYLCDMEKCETIKAPQLNDFKSLDSSMLQQLKDGSQFIFIPKGRMVFKEGQQLTKLYCLEDGACKFSKMDTAGHEHILKLLGKGELLGKRSLISHQGAKVSARTLKDSRFWAMDRGVIQKAINENPKFCKQLLFALTDDLNQSEHSRVLFSSSKGIRQRLASLLLYLNDKFGINTDGELALQLKREDMAAILGTSPEYIINILKEFKSQNLISTSKTRIKIISTAALEKRFS